MKTEVIPNQYDGPRPPARRLSSGHFSLDYANSDDAAEIDAGIRETIRGVRLSILAMGIGLAKIKAKGLYIDLKYHSMAKYIESLCEQTRMDRSSLHNWLYIGEAPAAPEESAIQVKGNQVYIGDRLAVTLDEGMDPKTRAY
jgi:hypothetical protein